ncbi:MAG: 6-phosphogluconolactonase [Blastochloris sp.]|nr:6-phosphogluconolactonase [Blastochloris sp.]
MTHHKFTSESDWIDALIRKWQEIGTEALQSRGTFYVSLSGGSSPASLYRALASTDWPWSSTVMFIGDERWVSSEHKDSNYHMIYECFYPHKVRLERWRTELAKPEEAATDYHKRLCKELGQPPRFDLALLGVGNDGHTASLFPGTPALLEEEHYTTSNWVPQMDSMRLTMTYRLFYQAREILFVSKGASKQEWLDKLEKRTDTTFPAARIESKSGLLSIYNCVN